MSTTARIDELRKKFEENPRRYFAPLANEYRKSGELAQAIALCREHLPKQPGHMSGYIVFGQALYEAGELAEARSVFEQALDLDPENLIALRHLGDIADVSGDRVSARRWYARVLDADPRNDDIAARLAGLASTGRTPVSSPTVPSFESLSRVTETPAAGLAAIGLGAVPTPDSVLRAVDVDAFSARVPHHSPIDLEAIHDPPAEAVSVSSEDTDPFGFPPVQQPSADADDVVQAAHGDVNIEASEADFEEGLAAPQWPDTADLVARVVTPRSVTPLATPVYSSESLDDAVRAFGREASDPPTSPVDAAFEDQSEIETAEYAMPTPAMSQEAVEAASAPSNALFDDEPVADVASAHADEPDRDASVADGAVSEPSADAERASTADVPPAIYAHVASESMDAESVIVDAAHENVVSAPDDILSEPEDMSIEPDAMFAVAAADETDGSEPLVHASEAEVAAEWPIDDAEDVVDAAAFTVAPRTTDDVFADDEAHAVAEASLETDASPTPLPWIAGAESVDAIEPVSLQDVEPAEPGLEAIVEAFAEDARSAGEDRPLAIAALDEAVQRTPAAGAPAFVTETMAELLVSQGFVGRAVDVYEELVRRRPFDPVLSTRLAELKATLAASEAAPLVEASVTEPESESPEAMFADEDTGADASTDWASSVREADERAEADAAAGRLLDVTPAYGTPAWATPAVGTPPLATAAITSESFEPAAQGSSEDDYYDTPIHTPLVTPPVAPYAQPAVVEELRPRRSARDWFAALAARRVPRRTPASAAPAVAAPAVAAPVAQAPEPEGLALLFGADAGAQEDGAARALADAFAPVSPEDLESGTTLDFEYARSTTPAFTPAMTTNEPAVSPSPVSGITPADANAGFAFDKFFPDPAVRRGTPAAPGPATPDAPVTDDLAQFSAWLKGLGNT